MLIKDLDEQPRLTCNDLTQAISRVDERGSTRKIAHGNEVSTSVIDWLEQAGFNATEVRILPSGAFIARNLNTGGQSAGKVF